MPEPQKQNIPDEILELAETREKHREAKEFQKADMIRDQIKAAGYIIDDTAYGPLISAEE